MSTLSEFILARVGEDEAATEAVFEDMARWDSPEWASPSDAGADSPAGLFIARYDPARVLRQCEAIRRIVEEWREALGQAEAGDMSGKIALFAFELSLRHLAAVYSDHPEYRDEWRT